VSEEYIAIISGKALCNRDAAPERTGLYSQRAATEIIAVYSFLALFSNSTPNRMKPPQTKTPRSGQGVFRTDKPELS